LLPNLAEKVKEAPSAAPETPAPVSGKKRVVPPAARLGPWAFFSLFVLSCLAVAAASFLYNERMFLEKHIARESSEIVWAVFLDGHADRAVLEESLRSLPGLRSLRFISQEEALDNVAQDPELSESLTLTGRNPFPEYFDVRWDPLFMQGDYLSHAAGKIRGMDGVDHVGFDGPRVERLALLQRLFYQMELLFMAVLWTAAVLSLTLLGRLVLFPSGAFPGANLAAAALAGLAGGAAGALAAQRFVSFFSWHAVWVGLAGSLLFVLIQES
jgi:hypothetical protein